MLLLSFFCITPRPEYLAPHLIIIFCIILQKTSSLSSPTFHSASFLVPSRGWFIYGGHSSSTESQYLQTLMGSWKTGPGHYEDFETGLCSVQVLECIVIHGGGREEKLVRSKTFIKFSFMVCVCICMCVCVCVCVCVLSTCISTISKFDTIQYRIKISYGILIQ